MIFKFGFVRFGVAVAIGAWLTSAALADTIFKANNSIALSQTNSWQAGGPPGASDIAAWDATVGAGNGTVSLSAELSWEGLLIGYPTQPGVAIIFNSPGTLTLGVSGISLNGAGTARNLTINTPVILGATQVWDVATSRTLTASAGVSGTGPLTKTGGGTLTMTGTGNYSDGTRIGGGTVSVNADAALGASGTPVTFFDSATLTMSTAGSYGSGRALWLDGPGTTGTLNTAVNTVWAGVMDGEGSLVKAGAGLLTLTADNTYTGETAVTAGTLQALPGAGWSPHSALRLAGGVWQHPSGGTFYGALGTEAGDVRWTGSGGFSVTNGNLTVNLGGSGDTLAWGSTTGFVDSGSSLIFSSVYAGGTVAFENPVDLNGATRTIQVDNGTAVVDAAFTQPVSGAGAGLIKTGSGTLALADGNTFDGSLWVQAGAVRVTQWSATTPGGTTLRLGNTTVAGHLEYAGDTAVLVDTHGIELPGTTGGGSISVVGSGTVHIATGIASTTANTQGRSVTLRGSNTGSNTVSGPITQLNDATGTALVKEGEGTWILAGTNTYTGQTTVNAGILRLGAPEILHDNGTLRVAGGTFDLGGHTESVAQFTLTSGVVTGGTLVALVNITADSGTAAALIQGPVTPFTKNTTGTATLTEPNPFGGQLSVNYGTLVVSHLGDAINGTGNIRMGSSANFTGELEYNGTADVVLTSRALEFMASNNGGGRLTVSGPGTLTLRNDVVPPAAGVKPLILQGSNTGTNTFAGVIANGVGAVSLTKAGAGRWILTGNNAYSGTTTISDGILQIGNGSTSGVLPTNTVITAPGVLVFNRSDAVAFNSLLSSTGALRQDGPGELTLAYPNTYSGGTTINAGTVTYGHALALGPVASARVVFGPASSGRLRLNGFSPTLIGLEGDATAVVENASASTASTLNLAIASGTHVFDGLLQNGGAQSLALTKSGAGTLVLGGPNTFTGPTTITLGTVEINAETRLGANPPAFGAGHLTLNGTSAALKATSSFAIDDVNRGITLGASGGSFDVAEGLTLTLANPVTGTGALRKTDNGTVILTADNSYAATTLTAGTLQVGNGGATGTLGSGATANAGALVFNRTGEYTYAGVISGTGTVSKLGSGVVSLTGGSSHTGVTTIEGGVLRIVAQTGLGGNPPGSTDNQLTLNGGALRAGATFSIAHPNLGATLGPNGGTLDVEPTFTLTMARPIVGAGMLSKTGAGTLILTGDAAHAGTTTIADGTLQVGAGATIGSLTGAISNNAALVFNRSDAVDVPYSISGTGSVTKLAANTLTFTEANPFTGPLWIQNGILSVAALGNAINGSGPIRLGTGTTAAELEYTGAAPVSLTRDVDLAGTTGGGRISVNGAGSVILNGDLQTSGSGAKSLTLQGSNTGGNTMAGLIGNSAGGSTSLIKAGNGTWILTGDNEYSGTTSINAGILNIRNANALGTVAGAATLVSGAALELQNDISVGAQALTLAGTGPAGMGALRNISGNNTWGGNIALAAGGATVRTDAGSLTLNTFSGNTQPLTIDGAGTVILNGAVATTTGGITKNGSGIIRLGADNRLASNAPLTVNAGTFDLNSYTQSLAAVVLNDGQIASTGGPGLLIASSVTAHNGTISARLGDAASTAVTPFTKTGDGTVVLTRADNAFEGKASIQSGVLVVENLAPLSQNSGLGRPTTVPNGTIDLGSDTNAATLRIAGNSGDSITDRVLNLAGTTGAVALESTGSGRVHFSSALTATGAGAKTLTLGGDNTLTNALAGAIPNSAGGSTAIAKTGTGTWALSGASDYSGGTVVHAGLLLVNNSAGSGTGTGAVQVNAGAALGGSGSISGAVTLNSGARLLPGSSIGALTVGALALNAGSEMVFELNANPTNDQVRVTSPGGLTINGGGMYLYAEGTTTPWTTPGVYRLFQYSGSIGGAGVNALSVLNPQGGYTYDFRTNSGWVEIRITDGFPLVSIFNASVLEGNAGTKPMLFPITLDPTGSVSVTVHYETIDGTAKASAGDFQYAIGAFVIPPGVASTQLVVMINGDVQYELDETFTVQLSAPINATLLNNTATGTILNDDAPDGRVYVNANATGNNNGFNWNDGFLDLQDALRTATAGQQIWVAKGTYYPTNSAVRTAHFSLRPNIPLYGGFEGYETTLGQRNWMNATSILSGDIGIPNSVLDNCGPVVRSASGAGAVINGFTIAHGYNNSVQDSGRGGGMHIIAGSGTLIENCIFYNNFANESGALHVQANSTIRNTIFRNNSGTSRGGAVQTYFSNNTFVNCVFLYNSLSNGRGGAMSLYHQATTLMNCSYYGNSAARGNALYTSNGGSVNAVNNIFWDSGDHGGGIWVKSESANPGDINFSGPVSLSYCDVNGGFSPPELGTSTNEMNEDPLFVNANAGNLRLQAASPCRDAATSVGAPLDDADGGTRPVGAGYDMGAYEFGSTGPGVLPTGLILIVK